MSVIGLEVLGGLLVGLAVGVTVVTAPNGTESMRTLAKQFAVGLGITALLPLAVWYGVNLWSPPPDSKDHYKAQEKLDKKAAKAKDEAEQEKLAQEKERLKEEYEEAERLYYRDMFYVAYPVGVLAVLAGTLLRVQAV